MAHNLIPEIETTIHSATGNTYLGKAVHPSQLGYRFGQANQGYQDTSTSPQSHQSSQPGPGSHYIQHLSDQVAYHESLLPIFNHQLGQPRGKSHLDEFDRQLLHGFRPLVQPHQTNNPLNRLSIPLDRDMATTLSSQPMIYQPRQRQSPDQFLAIGEGQTGGEIRREPQDLQMTLPGLSRVYDNYLSTSHIPTRKERPAFPFSLDQFARLPSTQPARPERFSTRHDGQSSSPFAHSSPTQRITLRRASDRLKVTPYLNLAEKQYFLEDTDTIQASRSVSTRQQSVTSLVPGQIKDPPVPPNIQLVSPHELPDCFRQVFPYPNFNPVQSKCFQSIYKSTDNIVISAPTGSGKTALLELAVCKLVKDYDSGQFKIVYQAPTKSLCAERVRDWQRKFSHLNLTCAELTGDTDVAEMRTVGNAAIIVTTPEKWDSVTRKWKDHVKLLNMVKLFLIDEVHILKDIRGATLEAVVSRMKSIGAQVRFVALSATVPNSQDIATWLGKDPTNGDLPARQEIFGEDFRPVKLEKHVYGFNGNSNDFAFDASLDAKLPKLIAKHSLGKPMMVFCFTRKSCESTAAKLAQWWASFGLNDRAWPQPERKVSVGNRELQDLVPRGVAFHHAGLELDDRAAIETAFLKGGISVICCTSTLAVGINLPCHLVVIKNTVGYQDAGLTEYSDLELMQMLGRAGRPQFDNEAVAIIMTRSDNVNHYKKMISGREVIESTLHLNLIEHLNSEIGLGTVVDAETAKQWLAGTFLRVRMQQNPGYYKFNCDEGSRDADKRLEKVGERDIKLLQETNLITSDQRLRCTGYGLAMSKYMVAFETMKLLLRIPSHAKIGQLLHIICQAAEFKDLRMKATERSVFRAFNKSSFIKYPIEENVITSAHKVSLIVQVQLGGVDLPSDKDFNTIRKQYLAEKAVVFDRIQRLVKCVSECKINDCDAVATRNALDLSRSLAAGFWENSSLQMRQIDGIGPVAVRKLVLANIKTVQQLSSLGSADIERIMSRNPPLGTKILFNCEKFPRLALKAEITKNICKSGSPVKVQVKAEISAVAKIVFWKNRPIAVTFFAAVSNGQLGHIWRGYIKTLTKAFEINFLCEISDPTDAITCQVACDDIVGTAKSVILTHNVPATNFPVERTQELVMNDDDADFEWDETDTGDILAVVTKLESIAPKAIMNGGGSDYGDSIDGFMDVDSFDVEPRGKDDKESPQPVQMANGRWQCNHACRVGVTKKGATCMHKCCREGLAKPRKLQRPKRADGHQKGNEKLHSKVDKAATNVNLGDSIDFVDIEAVEEINFVDELSSHLYGEITPHEYERSLYTQARGQGPSSAPWPDQQRTSTHQTGSLSNLDFFDFSCDHNELHGLEDLPLPSQLMGHSGPCEYDAVNTTDVHETVSQYENPFKFPESMLAEPTESFPNEVYDFSAFSQKPSTAILTQAVKRGLPFSPVTPEAKRLKHNDEVAEEQEATKIDSEMSLPEWTNEIAPNLIEFFKGWVEFEP